MNNIEEDSKKNHYIVRDKYGEILATDFLQVELLNKIGDDTYYIEVNLEGIVEKIYYYRKKAKFYDGNGNIFIKEIFEYTSPKHLQLVKKDFDFIDIKSGLLDYEVFKQRVISNSKIGKQMVMAIIDMDRFKEINDRYGHLEGDKKIFEVATFLRKNIRSNDLVTRYGGDEFVIVFFDCSLESAIKKIEKLKDTWNNISLYNQKGANVTFSGGIDYYRFDEDLDDDDIQDNNFEDNFYRIDKLLYVAKSYGGNIFISGDKVESIVNDECSNSQRNTKRLIRQIAN